MSFSLVRGGGSRSRTGIFVLLLAAVSAAALGACARTSSPLTVYSGRGESLVGPLLERFAEETGIPVDVRYGDSADLALLLAEEGRRSPADVFLSQSPGAVGFLSGRGLLARLGGGVLDAVDPKFRNGAGRWVGVTGRQRVLVYNKDLVREADLPASVLEVTAPRFSGKVAVAPQNASFQDFVTAMRQLLGEDQTLAWLKALAGTGAPVYPNNNAIVEAVGRGEVPMGLVNHYYNFRFLKEDPGRPSRNHVFPNRDLGSLLIVSSVSIVESSDQKERAMRFVEFLLSREAQQYFSEETFEYPLAAGVRPAGDLPTLDLSGLPAYDADDLGEGLERTARLIAESGLQK